MKAEKPDCNRKKKENADSKFRRHLENKFGLAEEGTERSRQLDVLTKIQMLLAKKIWAIVMKKDPDNTISCQQIKSGLWVGIETNIMRRSANKSRWETNLGYGWVQTHPDM